MNHKDPLQVEITLYRNGELIAGGALHSLIGTKGLSIVKLPCRQNTQVYTMTWECQGEPYPSWLAFRIGLTNDFGDMVGLMTPALVFCHPHDVPSVTMIPSIDVKQPGIWTVVTRVPRDLYPHVKQ